MWKIDTIDSWTKEPGRIFGGLGEDVSFPMVGKPLIEKGTYVVAPSATGALLLKDRGTLLEINGVEVPYDGDGVFKLYYLSPESDITIVGGRNKQTIPLYRDLLDCGPLVPEILKLIRDAPTLHSFWDEDPLRMLYKAGFPAAARYNIEDLRREGEENPWEEFVGYLRSVKFEHYLGLDDRAQASWWACTLCKAGFAALAAAAMAVALIIVAASGGVLALAGTAAVTALAASAGLTATALAGMLIGAVTGTAGAALGVFLQSLCSQIGACA